MAPKKTAQNAKQTVTKSATITQPGTQAVAAAKQVKKPGRVPIPESQVKLVFGYSAGWCAFPNCAVRNLVEEKDGDPSVVIGEIAHIHSYEDNGPRANKDLSSKERNLYPNLVLFCPTHHTIVDKQPNAYTADDLRGWKDHLMKRVKLALSRMMPHITFAELQTVSNGLLATLGSRTIDFSVIPPEDKMLKNGLSPMVKDYLVIALGRANVVAEFVDSFTRYDATFSERLRAGFVERYQSLKSLGLQGDELFVEMLAFSSASSQNLKNHAAGLAVLGYFFEACEVFEK